MTTELYIALFVGALVGIIIGYLIALQMKHSADQLQKAKESENHTNLVGQMKSLETECHFKSQQIEELKKDFSSEQEELKALYTEKLNELKTQHIEDVNELKAQHAKEVNELKAQRTEEINELKAQHQEHVEQELKLVTEQMKSATEEMLRQRSEQLQLANREQMENLQNNSKEQLARILDPLHSGLKQMQEQVEKADREQTEKMTTLDATIKATLQQTANVSASADKLANALTSENKTVGNFGELRLRTLLENMGFQEGLQFEEQNLLRDETGKVITHDENGQKLIPDTIIHFPEGRDLIIDSKMSLKAFNEYFNAETDEERAIALKRHVESVRNHVDGLSAKKYYKYISGERQTVDFVVMYMYSDSALQLALSSSPTLWEDAAKKGVLITGSHNLYMMLRIVQMSWDRMHQAENVQKIMEQANSIVQRVQDFYTRLIEVEEGFKKTQKAFDSLKVTTGPQGRSIITAAHQLIAYGAKEDRANKKRRRLPSETKQENGEEDELLLENGENAKSTDETIE